MSRLVTALHDARRSFARVPVALSLVSAAVGLSSAALLLWRWTQLPFIVFALAPLFGGYVRLCAEVGRGGPVRFGALWSGFREIDRWTGIMVMLALHATLTLLPLCVGIGLGNMAPPDARPFWWAAGSVVSAPTAGWMLVRLWYVPIAAVDAERTDSTAIVFERATGRAKSEFAVTLGAVVVSSAFVAVSVAVGGWPLPVIVPLVVLMNTALYDARPKSSVRPIPPT